MFQVAKMGKEQDVSILYMYMYLVYYTRQTFRS